jgi:hypothetical protein
MKSGGRFIAGNRGAFLPRDYDFAPNRGALEPRKTLAEAIRRQHNTGHIPILRSEDDDPARSKFLDELAAKRKPQASMDKL